MTAMKTDVLVIGGGPNGLAASLALGGAALRSPLNIIVIDASDPRAFALQGHDTRGTAITRSTQSMLQALGVWPALAPHAEEMRHITVTDGKSDFASRPTLLSFATDPGERAAASIVENRHIAKALLAAVEQSPCIRLMPFTTITNLKTQPGLAKAVTSTGETISASLIIAADGKSSTTRQSLGIKTMGHSYGQTALSFAVSHANAHAGTAKEHFSEDGVFAFLPLPGNYASIVWGTSPAKAAELLALSEAEFTLALGTKLGPGLGEIKLEGKRVAYPLSLQIAERFIAARTALVGDAAHAIHPLAGLGLNLGYKDVAALADCVADAFARGEDIGGAATLERYERMRRFDTLATAIAMEAMNLLFVNDMPIAREIRKFGLQAVNQLALAKSLLMKEAAGEVGNLPNLMQGLLPA